MACANTSSGGAVNAASGDDVAAATHTHTRKTQVQRRAHLSDALFMTATAATDSINICADPVTTRFARSSARHFA